MKRQVYFASGRGGLIKVGLSRDPVGRMQTLRSSSGGDVVLLGSTRGERQHEEALKWWLRPYHEHGEWFRPTQPVLREMDRALAEGLNWVGAVFKPQELREVAVKHFGGLHAAAERIGISHRRLGAHCCPRAFPAPCVARRLYAEIRLFSALQAAA